MSVKPETANGHRSAATAWLETLCQENVEFLHRSLPVRTSNRKRKRGYPSFRRTAAAIHWGASVLESDVDEGPDVLQRLVHLLTTQPKLRFVDEEQATATQKLRVKTSENIARWITHSLPLLGSDPYVGLVSVAWIYSLQERGTELPPSLWLETLQSVLTQVDRAWAEPAPDEILPWLLWSCEVPLALATQLSQLGSKDRMVIETLDRLAIVLDTARADPTAWVRNGARNLRALLASVVRSRWAADALGARAWYVPQRKALAQLNLIALSLSDAMGHPLLVDENLGSDDQELWTSLAEICLPNKSLAGLLATLFPKRSFAPLGKKTRLRSKRKRDNKKPDAIRLPEPGQYFEKAELATMRRRWSQAGFRVAVDYARDPMWIDCVGAGGERLLSGEYDLAIRRDGQVIETDVGWSEVCWFSDDDVDYLEVECAVEDECRIQRQIMLVREEGLMFFSDTLLANVVAQWSLDSSWTIGNSFELRQETKTHEAELYRRDSHDSRRALLLPLALPEWRRQPSDGRLLTETGKIILRQEVTGTRLYSPMILASRKSARRQPFTWRNLTVAEDLVIQPREVAQAYRVQIGKNQLVVYRSLEKTVRRSAMGLHLNSEFYAGRFDAEDGEYNSIVEINADDP